MDVRRGGAAHREAEGAEVVGRGCAAHDPAATSTHRAPGKYSEGWQGGEEGRRLYLEEDRHRPQVRRPTPSRRDQAVGIDNRRWAGIPFYLRAGKRLGRRVTEIAVVFKRAPHSPFDSTATEELGQNAMRHPRPADEGMTVRFGSKVPGTSMEIRGRVLWTSPTASRSTTSRAPGGCTERPILDVLPRRRQPVPPSPGSGRVLNDPRPDRGVLGRRTAGRRSTRSGSWVDRGKPTRCSHETDGAGVRP
ncbi:hypothetical protein [Streptomyces echinatus]|uniref:hypothetical protein n=1 Tax=Streptomyces echinatus TaxID=67293 RepID=UPI003CD0C022